MKLVVSGKTNSYYDIYNKYKESGSNDASEVMGVKATFSENDNVNKVIEVTNMAEIM